MVSLRIFLLVLITLVCRELCAGTTENTFLQSGIAVFGLAIGVCLFSKLLVLRKLVVAGVTGARFAAAEHAALDLKSIKNWVLTFWGVAYPLLIIANGWALWALEVESTYDSGALAVLLLFAPTLLLLVYWDVIEAEVDQLCDADERSWLQLWSIRTRLGDSASLLTCMAPVLLITCLNDASARFFPLLSEQTQAAIATSIAGLLIVVAYPIGLTLWYGGKPIECEVLRHRIDELRLKANIGTLPSILIPSGGRWNGAALVGWLPGLRRLWLGDGLLNQLTKEEVDMVVLHEIAHVKHMHFAWRFAPVIWSAGLATLVVLGLQWSSDGQMPLWLIHTFAAGMAVLTVLVGLGFVSWQCEYEADRSACLLAEQSCEWAEGQPGAPVIHLTSALCKLTGGRDSSDKSWMHPSLKDRLKSLAAFLSEQRHARISGRTT